MNKKRSNEILKQRFKSIPNNSEFIYFRNIRDFCLFKLELINPTHVGLVWGLPKKKLRRNKHPSFIRVAKVFFSLGIPIFSSTYFNALLVWLLYLLTLINPETLLLNLSCTCIFVYFFLNIDRFQKWQQTCIHATG